MAFPTGYVYHNGVWYDQATGLEYDPYKQVDDITEAQLALIAPSTDFIGREYDVTDRAGGTRVKNTGTTWREVSPGATEAASSSTWAARGTGSYVGQVKRITDIGNNPCVEVIWDGTYWQPRSGTQVLYTMAAQVVTASGTNQTATIPTFTLPGNLLNIRGLLRAEIAAFCDVTSTALTLNWTFGGNDLGGLIGANRRFSAERTVQNKASTAAQRVRQRATEVGGFTNVNVDAVNMTKDTTVDISITGNVNATHGTAIVLTLDSYRITWER